MSHLMSLSGVKRTCRFALRVSAFDPKRTLTKTRITDGLSVCGIVLFLLELDVPKRALDEAAYTVL